MRGKYAKCAEDARQKRGHDVEAREHADLPAKRVLDRAEHVAAPHVVLEALDTTRAASPPLSCRCPRPKAVAPKVCRRCRGRQSAMMLT